MRRLAASSPWPASSGGCCVASAARRRRRRSGTGRLGRHARARLAGARAAARDRSRGHRLVTAAVDELGRGLVDHALLEGDFVLRSGKRSSWYLDKYRFETQPDLLRALGDRLASGGEGRRAGGQPDCAAPALGAVALAASASMASDLPFIIVRGETKEYGTANRIEGPVRAGRARVPRRGRRHVRWRARGGGGRRSRGRSRRPARGVRRRPGGRGRRRARPARRSPAPALPCARPARPACRCREPAWLAALRLPAC